MDMEQMGGFEDERVGLRNQMQMMLAKRHGEDMGEFIAKHATQFGDYVKGNEGIIDAFRSNPESALLEVEKNLFH